MTCRSCGVRPGDPDANLPRWARRCLDCKAEDVAAADREKQRRLEAEWWHQHGAEPPVRHPPRRRPPDLPLFPRER